MGLLFFAKTDKTLRERASQQIQQRPAGSIRHDNKRLQAENEPTPSQMRTTGLTHGTPALPDEPSRCLETHIFKSNLMKLALTVLKVESVEVHSLYQVAQCLWLKRSQSRVADLTEEGR